MVGVISTVTVCRLDAGLDLIVGRMEISGSDTTAREPSERGCSGSEIVDIKSNISCSSMGSAASEESDSLSESVAWLVALEKGSLMW